MGQNLVCQFLWSRERVGLQGRCKHQQKSGAASRVALTGPNSLLARLLTNTGGTGWKFFSHRAAEVRDEGDISGERRFKPRISFLSTNFHHCSSPHGGQIAVMLTHQGGGGRGLLLSDMNSKCERGDYCNYQFCSHGASSSASRRVCISPSCLISSYPRLLLLLMEAAID